MSNTKSNPYTLIAGFLLPWKVTKNSTRKEQPNNNKKPCACGYCLCSNASKTPRGLPLCQGKFWQKNKNSKSQKVFDFSTFRFFWFFWLFDFSTFRLFETFRTFRIFRLFEQKSPGMWTFRLFDFSTFRGQKSWFSRCDRYQPEEHTVSYQPLWKMMEFGNVGMMTFPTVSGKSWNSMVPLTTNL